MEGRNERDPETCGDPSVRRRQFRSAEQRRGAFVGVTQKETGIGEAVIETLVRERERSPAVEAARRGHLSENNVSRTFPLRRGL